MKKAPLTVLISQAEESSWQSCRAITRGLRGAYTRAYSKRLSEFRVSNLASDHDLNLMADRVFDLNPDQIVFLDTHEGFGRVLKRFLARSRKTGRSPLIRFHVYGDFTLRAYQWSHWAKSLEGFTVEWACASPKQEQLVRSLLRHPEQATWVCPFAVDGDRYRYSATSRSRLRGELGFGPADRVLIYSGRLSLQKNIVALILAFEAAAMKNSNLKLLILGEFDDLGAPLRELGQLTRGAYFGLVTKTVEALSDSMRMRLKILRGVNSDLMSSYYSAADAFISLGLQHDEDFGMAPAEAAASGLPLILTDWGGFSAFSRNGPHVCVENAGAAIDLNSVREAIETWIAERPLSGQDRIERGSRNLAPFQESKIASLIQNHSVPGAAPIFTGFQPNVDRLANLFESYCGHLLFDSFEKGSVYEEVYRHYN